MLKLGFFNGAFFKIRLPQLLILIVCANPPVEMLTHMLKVSEDWLSTKSRLIGADTQSQNMPKAQFGVWPSFSLSLLFPDSDLT